MLEPTRLSHTPDAPAALHTKRTVDSMQDLGDLPDLLLIERSRGRDPRAFETLMRRYNRRLYRIARSILPQREAAEEAVRAAYLRAFANLDRYEPAGKFGAWLARLSFNEAIAMRRHAPGASGEPAGAMPAAGPSGTEPAADRQTIESAIDALPEVFRTVLVLRVIEDLSGVEVAACLSLNETTVRTRLYRSLQRLKGDLAVRLRSEPYTIFELTPERSDSIVAHVLSRFQTPVPADSR